MNDFNHEEALKTAQQQAGGTVDPGVMPMNLSAIDNLPDTVTRHYGNPTGQKKPLELLFDIPMELTFEVGRIDINIKQLMELKEGSMIDLRHVSVDSIDIRINGKVIGYGEAIGLQQSYGIRFGELEVFSQLDDIEHY